MIKLPISIGTTFNYEIPLKDQLPLVKKADFTHISLGGGNLEHSGYLTQVGQKNIEKMISNEGLRICSIHAPFFKKDADISSCDKIFASRSLDIFKKCIDAAVYLKTKVIICHPSPMVVDLPHERKKILVEQILKLIDYIGNNDMKLAVENLPSDDVNDLLRHSLECINNNKYGFCYDSSHDNLLPQPFEILEKYAALLITTHISDNRGLNDDHLLPFEGNLDWNKFSKVFSQINFKGIFLLEVEMRESAFKSPAEFLAEACRRGLKLLNLIC